MQRPQPDPQRDAPPAIAEQASLWLARRDRGLTAEEQDAYLQWLAADARHAEAMSQHATALERMMALYEWQPGQSAEPNPDLFAPRRRARLPLFAWGFAAAAALALCVGLWQRHAVLSPRTSALTENSYLRVNERHALPDGSVVELKDGSRIVTDFSPSVRRVRLTGEAHFTVSHDPSRPFVVDAEGVAIRAVGTAFNVRIANDAVEVLVTEGRVRVHPPAADGSVNRTAAENEDTAVPLIAARQRAIVSRSPASSPQVSDVTTAQLADALAWQAPRLQFFETPLVVAVAEFNQRNRTQIVIGDPELRSRLIGGSFRVANVEGFVRLLEVTLDLRATSRGPDEIVLTRAR